MKKLIRSFSISLILFLCLGIFFSAFAADAILLHYKPHVPALTYSLRVKNHSEVDLGQARNQGNIYEDHEDIITLSQRVERIAQEVNSNC